MLTIVTSYTRPNISVKFYVPNQDFADLFRNNYMGTGKILESRSELTSDGLTAVITAVWRTRADFAEFLDEPVLVAMKADRQNYMDANGITVEQTIEYIPTAGEPGFEELSE
jgi:hypothetical protein